MALRELTRAAGVNLAAVNYHYGDMAAVYREVVLRRLRPLNLARLQLLDEASQSAGGFFPNPPALWRALASPLFDLHRDNAAGGRAFALLISRILTEPWADGQRIIVDEYHPVLARFAQQFRRHAPQLSPEDFMWRFSFVIGSLHHTVATLDQMTKLTKGICRSDDHAGALSRFIAHAVASFGPSPTISGGSADQHQV